MTSLGDAGGWFRAATSVATSAWGLGGGGFGRVSPNADLIVALNLFRGRPTVVLTGAGISTGSGLSDYCGRGAVPCSPMIFQGFTGSDLSRRRYWVRSTVGWNWFEAIHPGLAYLALVGLGRRTSLAGVVTQNVDGFHQAAGSKPVVGLHGSLARVVCLGCGRFSGRTELQVWLLELNPEVAARLGGLSERACIAPDGDAEAEGMTGFTYPACLVHGGMLKPDVVYLSENARREMMEAANALFDAVEVLLVLDSILTVMSGLRFARQAVKQSKDVIIAGDGVTWADDLTTLRIYGRPEHILPFWAGAPRAG